MKERSILMSAPMVLALRDEKKTQTRRVVKWNLLEPINLQFSGLRAIDEGFRWTLQSRGMLSCWTERAHANCPYGKPGDRLWVREAAWVWCRKVKNGLTATGRQKYKYTPFAPHETGHVLYVADHPKRPERTSYAEPDMVWRYKHARYLPKHLSRISLEITDVRVQRLQEISDADCIAEGTPFLEGLSAKDAYAFLWNSINGPGSWDANPWVWALTFKQVQP